MARRNRRQRSSNQREPLSDRRTCTHTSTPLKAPPSHLLLQQGTRLSHHSFLPQNQFFAGHHSSLSQVLYISARRHGSAFSLHILGFILPNFNFSLFPYSLTSLAFTHLLRPEFLPSLRSVERAPLFLFLFLGSVSPSPVS